MSRLALALLFVLPLACEKKPPPAASSANFDKQWQKLEADSEPLFIEGGSGLMGEVRRAVDQPASAVAQEPWKGELPDPEVIRVIRSNLGSIKACYTIAEKANGQELGAGKAIVNLEIEGTGLVSRVQIDAPAFAASKLPECMSARARAWTFPKFTDKVAKKFAYPFVFVGG